MTNVTIFGKGNMGTAIAGVLTRAARPSPTSAATTRPPP